MTYIKQFGLQRSGTNVMKALIEVNYANTTVFANVLGDKHQKSSWADMASSLKNQEIVEGTFDKDDSGPLAKLIEDRDLNILINIKDPISWLESYYRYSLKKVLFVNPDADFPMSIGFCKKNLAKWETNLLSWLALTKEGNRCAIVRHVDILVNPESVLSLIEKQFKLTPARDTLQTRFEGFAKRGTDTMHGQELINSNMKFDMTYHTEKKWKDNFPQIVLEFSIEHCKSMCLRQPSLVDFVVLDIC